MKLYKEYEKYEKYETGLDKPTFQIITFMIKQDYQEPKH